MSSFKEILRATFITGRLTVVRIITSFGRSKLNAIIIGATGLGLYSQANYLSLFLASICSLGLVNGMMQRISHSRENNDIAFQRQVQGTVLVTQLVLLAVVLVISFFCVGVINKQLFGGTDPKLNFSILLVILNVVFVVIGSNYLEGFFFSYGRYDLCTKASIIATFAGFALFLPLIYFFGIYGAFASLFANTACLFIAYLYYIRRLEPLSNVFVFGFRKSIFLNILPEGLINLFYGVLVSCSALLIRHLMIKHEGAAENGLYQICTSITALYIPFLTNPLWAKLFPEVSAKGSSAESGRFFYNILVFTVLTSVLCVLGLFMKPDLIILTLASKEFVPSVKFFPFYFPGDFFFNIIFAYSVYLLALRKIKEYTLIWVCFFGLQYVLSVFLLKPFDALAIAIAYAASALIVLIFIFIRLLGIIKEKFPGFILLFLSCVMIMVIEGYLLYQDYSFFLRIGAMILWIGFILIWQKEQVRKFNPFLKNV